MKTQTNIRTSKLTRNQLEKLVAITAMSQTEIVSNLIGEMYGRIVNANNLATAIFERVFPNTDDKDFRHQKIVEIHDWLTNGDMGSGSSLDELVAEWIEYDVPEEREE